MSDLLISLVLAASVVLIHFAYVDFRFRYRDGMVWYWMLNPAPVLMWIGRALIAAALIFSLGFHFVHPTKLFIIVMAGLMIAHLISLILLEVLEPR